MKEKHLNLLTILKPGLLKNRKDARTTEKVLGWIPFVTGIEARDASLVCQLLAERQRKESYKSKDVVKVLENKDMLNVLKE